MSILSSLFSNDKVKEMALGMLKRTMTENDIKYVVIDRLADDTLDMQMFRSADQPVIMSATNMQALELAMQKLSGAAEVMELENQELLEKIEKLRNYHEETKADHSRLLEISLEQEQALLQQNEQISQYAAENARLRESLQLYGVGENNIIQPENDTNGNEGC